MGLFIRKETAGIIGKAELTKSYLRVTVCAVLVVFNVLAFALTTTGMATFVLIVSNALTALLVFLSLEPANRLIQNALLEKHKEIENQNALRQRINELEKENNDLAGKLDTRYQTESMAASLNYTFKLEQMEYSRKGYLVKEQALDSLADDARYQNMIPEKGGFSKLLEILKLKEEGLKKILYVRKSYYKASIGIDFGRIKYAMKGDDICFAGVRFSKLHDITSEMVRDESDIDRCFVLNETAGGLKIEQGGDYDVLLQAYSDVQADENKELLEKEVDNICREYTEVLQDSLSRKFRFVKFVEDGEVLESELTWYALREGCQDRQVGEVASNMIMLADVMSQTKAIDNQELEKISSSEE